MDRLEVLQKLAAGEISVEDATRLLQDTAAQPAESDQPASASAEGAANADAQPQAQTETSNGEWENKVKHGSKPRWLKIRVGKASEDRDFVRINIPIGWVTFGVSFGERMSGVKSMANAWGQMLDAVERGESGTLVEVEDDHDGERVRIYVE